MVSKLFSCEIIKPMFILVGCMRKISPISSLTATEWHAFGFGLKRGALALETDTTVMERDPSDGSVA